MICPFCAEDIKDAATACRHCGRDLTLVKALAAELKARDDQIARLQSELAVLRSGAAAEAKAPPVVTAPGGAEPAATAATAVDGTAATTASPGWTGIITLWLAPFLGLIVAHYLIVVHFDLNPLILRAVSIVVPIVCVVAHPATPRLGRWGHLMAALALGVSSVWSMCYVVHLVDHVPILPIEFREWRELGEYASSIALSFLTGALLVRLIVDARAARPISNQGLATSANFLVRMIDQTIGHAEAWQARIDGLQKVANTLAPVGMAAGAVIAGIRSLLP